MRVLFLISCLAVNLIYAKEQTQKQINIENVTTTQDICEKSFFFLRHGASNWNKDMLALGPQNLPINSKGSKQLIIL